MKKQSELLKKTFQKGTAYREVNGKKVYGFETVFVGINTKEGRIVYTITRSNGNKIYHHIQRRFTTGTERVYNLDGKITSKIYETDEAFEKAILRIEKMMK